MAAHHFTRLSCSLLALMALVAGCTSTEPGTVLADGGLAADGQWTDSAAEEKPDGALPDGGTEFQVFGDHRLLDGFKTYPTTPTTTSIGELIPATSTGSPTWNLVEWHSAGLLALVPPTEVELGSQWSNGYKRVIVGDGFLELAVNSDAEYGGVYRKKDEQWPHLLVSQKIYDGNEKSRELNVHDYESLILSMNLELAYANHIRNVGQGYDSSLHACQFLMFITLQNRNKDHPDYGNFIWFGLSFYDDRYEFVDEGTSFEVGVGKYIFRMAAEDFMPESLHNTSSVDISVNLAPVMREKLEEAIELGMLKSANLDDYYLGGMNMGFELPGRSVATMRVSDLSLVAKPK